MKKLKLAAVVLAALTTVFSCSKYDDSALLSEIQNLKDKIADLENQVPFNLAIAEDTVCMANHAESFRSRVYEVPFTLTGAVDNITVTANRNDIPAPDYFLFGENLVFDSYGNTVEVVMDSKTSGKIVITQNIGKVVWSDEEFMVYYLGSVINVTAVDPDGRACVRTIRLGEETVYSDYLDFLYDTMLLDTGSPNYITGPQALDFTLSFVFNCEFVDKNSPDGVFNTPANSFFYVDLSSQGIPNSDVKIEPQFKALNGSFFSMDFPVKISANTFSYYKSSSLRLYKMDHYTPTSNSASGIWAIVIRQANS